MEYEQPKKLDPPVHPHDDHVLGNPDAELTLVEYGGYTCRHCRAAQDEIANLRDRFGERMRYVFRQRPNPNNELSMQAAELAEYAAEFGQFWPVHVALMNRGPNFSPGDFERIASEFNLPPPQGNEVALQKAKNRVQDHIRSAERSGATLTPTFLINGLRYEGPWDENTVAEAMLGTLGHRIQAAAMNFVRWAPSAGLLLLFVSVAAVLFANSPLGSILDSFWKTPFGVTFAEKSLKMPLVDWINHGLLSIFFLVVGLEIKREFTVGRLSTWRAGAFPVLAAFGGMIVPIVIYLVLAPNGPLSSGWGVPIATDTAFAVALIILLGTRVPVELRVFLTAAVIIDDLAAIGVIAVFYSKGLDYNFLIISGILTTLLIVLNKIGIYRWVPYTLVGLILWICLYESGLHATLAGVILALVTPTRPPANLRALTAQLDALLRAEIKVSGNAIMQHGPSKPTMEALDAIHDRIESPGNKLLRSIEPWSSYLVLPFFALANAGVVMSLDVFKTHSALMSAIIFGLVLGKPLGIVAAAWLGVRLGLATKPKEYSWRQLCGAGALAGIGFTMSLFIAGEAFPNETDFSAAKIAIFIASILAGVLGTAILWPRHVSKLDASMGKNR